MCDEGTKKIIARLDEMIEGRQPVDAIYLVSDSQPFTIDYKERRHIFIWSPNAITLKLEELGNYAISAYTWTNFSFTTGIKVYTSGQTNAVAVFIRCTDEVVA